MSLNQNVVEATKRRDEEFSRWGKIDSKIQDAVEDAWNQCIDIFTGCYECRTGFPINRNGEHYGTQSLGMIPNTPCSNKDRI